LIFLRKYLPRLAFKSVLNQKKLLHLFQQIKFVKGDLILKEGDFSTNRENSYIYLIAEGEVRVEVNHNPITKLEFNKKHGVNSERVDAAHDTATGKGNLSRTVTHS
jgi:hypothetical protein